MSKAVIRRAIIRGLVSAGLFVAQTSSFTQVRSPALERDQVAQFCAPTDQAIDAPRVYCSSGRWARLEHGIAAVTAAKMAASRESRFLWWSSLTRPMPALGCPTRMIKVRLPLGRNPADFET